VEDLRNYAEPALKLAKKYLAKVTTYHRSIERYEAQLTTLTSNDALRVAKEFRGQDAHPQAEREKVGEQIDVIERARSETELLVKQHGESTAAL